jgi:ArsR family transcriptional regulator, arsenate/arsenite/antimonite-responsive transcriptional repressor
MTQVSKRRPLTPKLAAGCCGPIDELLDAELFKGLCDPTRSNLLACLSKCGRACSVSEVAECCSVDFSVVSRHLALLERAGIVKSSKAGRTVFYMVKYGELSAKLRALADAVESCGPSSKRGKGNGGGKGGCCGLR